MNILHPPRRCMRARQTQRSATTCVEIELPSTRRPCHRVGSMAWRLTKVTRDYHTGEGKLVFANGEFRGIFNNGKHVDGQFVFSDGLVYVEDDWKYCTSADRRLHSEMKA